MPNKCNRIRDIVRTDTLPYCAAKRLQAGPVRRLTTSAVRIRMDIREQLLLFAANHLLHSGYLVYIQNVGELRRVLARPKGIPHESHKDRFSSDSGLRDGDDA